MLSLTLQKQKDNLRRDSPARSSHSSSSSKEKLVGSALYMPPGVTIPRNTSDEYKRRRSTPVDVVDFSSQYGNPNSLMLFAFFFMMLGKSSHREQSLTTWSEVGGLVVFFWWVGSYIFPTWLTGGGGMGGGHEFSWQGWGWVLSFFTWNLEISI